MKRIITIFVSFFMAVSVFAQAPQMMSYQAVVRNANNALVTNQSVSVQISILQGSAEGSNVFVETQTAVTNANGLMTLQIGAGTVISGNFSTIDWSAGPYFLKTELDPDGGINYSIETVQQLLSVPYAMYAQEAGNGFSGDYNDLDNTPVIPSIPENVSAFTNDAGYLTSFTEQQALSISNDTLFLSGGGFVVLPALPTNLSQFTNDMNFVTTLDVQQAAGIPTNVSAFINDAGYLTSFTEQQALSISNDTIFLSGGGFVKLPEGFDGNYNSLTNKPELFSGDYNDLSNLPAIPSIPSNVSAFTNDAGYVSNTNCEDVTLCTLASLVAQMQSQMADMQLQLDSLMGVVGHDTTTADTTSHGGGEVTVTIPVVTTAMVNNVSATSAICGGNVIENGGAAVAARGVCWSTSPDPTTADSHTTDGNGIGTFISTLSGLSANTMYYVRAYATNSAGTAYGSSVSFTTLNDVADGLSCPGMPTVSDVDGNVYNTVKIGNQCWMKENLKTMHFADGTDIDLGNSLNVSTPYRYYPGGNSMNVSTYGYLYNWTAVMHGGASSSANPSGVQGICPTGWHVPSDAEWTQLTDYVSSQPQFLCDDTPNYIAKALASANFWNSYAADCVVGNLSENNNTTGFSALPAGSFLGTPSAIGNTAYFWSSTENDTSVGWGRNLSHQNVNVGRSASNKVLGCSVRCIQD